MALPSQKDSVFGKKIGGQGKFQPNNPFPFGLNLPRMLEVKRGPTE